jgi:hypothetical protein
MPKAGCTQRQTRHHGHRGYVNIVVHQDMMVIRGARTSTRAKSKNSFTATGRADVQVVGV